MAAPRKEENIKEIIIDTTEELLQSNSMDSLSLASIASAAGISKGTLYHHYKTKEDILLGICDRFLEQQYRDFLEWTEDKEKDTSVHRLIKYVIERNVSEIGPRLHILYHGCIDNEDIREKLIARYHRFQQIIASKISERVGTVSADYVSWLLLLVSDGLIIQSGLKTPDLDIEDFIHQTEKYARFIVSKF